MIGSRMPAFGRRARVGLLARKANRGVIKVVKKVALSTGKVARTVVSAALQRRKVTFERLFRQALPQAVLNVLGQSWGINPVRFRTRTGEWVLKGTHWSGNSKQRMDVFYFLGRGGRKEASVIFKQTKDGMGVEAVRVKGEHTVPTEIIDNVKAELQKRAEKIANKKANSQLKIVVRRAKKSARKRKGIMYLFTT